MDWVEFISAGLLFLLSHRLPTIPTVRGRLVAVIGARGFLVGYALLSLVTLAWLIVAAGRAPYVELWSPEPWQAWIPLFAMPIACLLVAFSVGVPNPLSFGGGDGQRFDPVRPGFVGFVRHGLLWAFAVWSVAHIIPNGNVAHVILFAVFALFSVSGMVMIDKRKQRQLGTKRWRNLARATSLWPGQSIVTGRWKPSLWPLKDADTFKRLAAAAALFFGALWMHESLVGVTPLPG